MCEPKCRLNGFNNFLTDDFENICVIFNDNAKCEFKDATFWRKCSNRIAYSLQRFVVMAATFVTRAKGRFCQRALNQRKIFVLYGRP